MKVLIHVLKFIIILHFVEGNHILTRIVGGKPVEIENYPYQLLLKRDDMAICGAVLLNENTALTAAHCLSKPGFYYVKAGSSYLNRDGTTVFVKKAIVHPNYDFNRKDFDLAVLKLEESVQFSESIKPVQLPEEDSYPPLNISGTVTGWGYVNSGIPILSSQLRAVDLHVRRFEECSRVYPANMITSRMFCAGGGEQDACQGDSGSPYVYDNVLYGLVSWGKDCASIGYPGVFTNVAYLRRFIDGYL